MLHIVAVHSATFRTNDVRAAENRILQRNFCNATFRKLQRNFCFHLSCGMLQGCGLEGWGLGLPEKFLAPLLPLAPVLFYRSLTAKKKAKKKNFFTATFCRGSHANARARARARTHTHTHTHTCTLLTGTQRGRDKGGCKQMQANTNKCRQMLANVDKRRGENACKRKQQWTNLQSPLWLFLTPPFANPLTKKKKAYTTTTERKSFGELFWPQRKTFQAGGGYKNPIKTRKTISTTEIFPLWTPFFSAKKSSALEWGGVCFLFPSLITVCPNS